MKISRVFKALPLFKQHQIRFSKSLIFCNKMAVSSTIKPEDLINNPGPFDKITHEERYKKNNKILDNVLEAVGNTPLVRLNKIPKSFGVKCEILVKCEYFNPGGSIKDRIAMRMINDAINDGRLKEDGVLIEPSSGNTAISLGLVSAIRGIKTIITIADKNAGDKVTMMKALGLGIVKTPSSAAYNDPKSYFCVAEKMSKEIPGGLTLNQYNNISNALANYDQTGEEILEQCDYKIDAVVMGTGTGGTMTGISKKIKEKLPECKIVGVDPEGSIMAEPDELNSGVKPYKVEGLGHDYVPNTCVRRLVDHWVKSNDKESFDLARRMIKEEGLFVGSSCGSALQGAIKYALDHDLDETKRIVVVLPDGVRNYMSKFASDDWMVDFGFLPLEHYLNPEHKLYGKKVRDLTNLENIRTHTNEMTIKQALVLFDKGAKEIVLEKNCKVEGIVSEANFITSYYEKKLEPTDTLKEVNPTKVPIANLDTDLSVISKLLERHQAVFAEEETGQQGTISLYRITARDLLKLTV